MKSKNDRSVTQNVTIGGNNNSNIHIAGRDVKISGRQPVSPVDNNSRSSPADHRDSGCNRTPDPNPGQNDRGMTYTPTFDCFLSHNSRDKAAVRELAVALRARGISVWLDEEQLRPGVPWQPLLESGIRASRSIAVLVGADGLGPWEDREMRAALSLGVQDGRPVIPVLLADVSAVPELPLFLREHTWVDLSMESTAGNPSALDRLIWGITGNPPTSASL